MTFNNNHSSITTFYFIFRSYSISSNGRSQNPSQQNKTVNLLSTKFTLRVDLDRKILEHAAPADTDTHPEPEEEELNSKKVKTA